MNFHSDWEKRRLTTPRTAAIAGILFGLLFSASLVLMRTAIPGDITADITWISTGSSRISVALGLMPFAGIAYLWFIGVVRDRLGEFEDKFFSTVFFGSSLLFIGLVFIAMAIAGGILATYQMIGTGTPDITVIYFARALMLHISSVYALRMAGVTMISLGTIWMRTGLLPRWLAVVTFSLALVLLVVVNYSPWFTLVYPAWVTLISLYILWVRLQHPDTQLFTPETTEAG
ncbi:MAG: hypothetical protein ACM3XO_16515 [Bacteroidota bacterium]